MIHRDRYCVRNVGSSVARPTVVVNETEDIRFSSSNAWAIIEPEILQRASVSCALHRKLEGRLDIPVAQGGFGDSFCSDCVCQSSKLKLRRRVDIGGYHVEGPHFNDYQRPHLMTIFSLHSHKIMFSRCLISRCKPLYCVGMPFLFVVVLRELHSDLIAYVDIEVLIATANSMASCQMCGGSGKNGPFECGVCGGSGQQRT